MSESICLNYKRRIFTVTLVTVITSKQPIITLFTAILASTLAEIRK
jgi:hypothetical protein